LVTSLVTGRPLVSAVALVAGLAVREPVCFAADFRTLGADFFGAIGPPARW
jgi:hypothetical protein